MTRLIDNLGLNFSNEKFNEALDPYGNLNKSLIKTPSPYKKWQFDAVANDDINGYFKNPMLEISQEIRNAANTMYTASTPVAALAAITTAAGGLAGFDTTTGDAENPPIVTTHVPGQIVQFINHTNRISGVVPITANTDAASKPHLEQAMQIGRALTYVIYQVDGREDNAPMLGSFTSILVANTVSDYANVIVTYPNTVNNSISTTIDPITFDSISTSNLTYNTVNSIAEFANTLYTLLHDRRIHDENFYTKSNQLVNEAKNIRRYENLGASEDNLVQNLIGSDKLKSRLGQP